MENACYCERLECDMANFGVALALNRYGVAGLGLVGEEIDVIDRCGLGRRGAWIDGR